MKSSRTSWEVLLREALVLEIRVEDRHGEVERAVAVLVVDEEHAHEFLTDLNFRRVGLLRATDDADRVVRKGLAQIALDFSHLGFVHYRSFLDVTDAALAMPGKREQAGLGPETDPSPFRFHPCPRSSDPWSGPVPRIRPCR